MQIDQHVSSYKNPVRCKILLRQSELKVILHRTPSVMAGDTPERGPVNLGGGATAVRCRGERSGEIGWDQFGVPWGDYEFAGSEVCSL